MACYLVSFDMVEGGDYVPLIKAIKSYSAWAHITESTWAVVTESDHKEVRNHLGRFLPEGSHLFVAKSSGVAAWRNVLCKNEWLKKYI